MDYLKRGSITAAYAWRGRLSSRNEAIVDSGQCLYLHRIALALPSDWLLNLVGIGDGKPLLLGLTLWLEFELRCTECSLSLTQNGYGGFGLVRAGIHE